MKKLKVNDIEYILRELESAEKEHPRATVYYDVESNEIRITYPLPTDFNSSGKYIKF